MMRFLKLTVPLAIVVAALAAVVWFADLGGGKSRNVGAAAPPPVDVEALISNKTGLSIDSIHRIEAAALAVAADKGAAKGYLTADQAAKVRSLNVSPILDRIASEITTATNTPATDILAGLENGQSLAIIAAAHGVDRATLKTNLTSALTSELATEKGAGLLTDQQASLITGLFSTKIDQILDAVHHHDSTGTSH
jgi:hypothetical protein